jgi:hypothetical protein
MSFTEKLSRWFLIPAGLRDTEALKKTAAGFAAQVTDAEKITDPGERLGAALAAEKNIRTYEEETKESLKTRASDFGRALPAFVVGVPLTLGAFAIGGIAGSTLLAIVSLFGAAFGIDAAAKFAHRTFESRQAAAIGDHLEDTGKSCQRAARLADNTLDQNAAEVAASPKFPKLYDGFPQVRKHFDLAVKQASVQTALGAPAPAAPSLRPAI